jgi:hypothetical protein
VAPGRIFYLCPDLRSPIGGVKQIYRHVEILDSAGFNATVLHHERDPGIFHTHMFRARIIVLAVNRA